MPTPKKRKPPVALDKSLTFRVRDSSNATIVFRFLWADTGSGNARGGRFKIVEGGDVWAHGSISGGRLTRSPDPDEEPDERRFLNRLTRWAQQRYDDARATR